MKKLSIGLRVIQALILMFVLCPELTANATINNESSFFTKDMSKEAICDFLDYTNLSLSNNVVRNSMINSFSVNESGMVAIAFDSSPRKIINVFDNNMHFQYGFVFDCNGSYGIVWQQDNLGVYFVRSNVFATFDSSGACVSIASLDDRTSDAILHNNDYRNHVVFADSHKVGNVHYELNGALGKIRLANSKLSATSYDGEERTLYDASKHEVIGLIFCGILFAVPVLIVCTVLFKLFKRQ